jgi:hypothetical protein
MMLPDTITTAPNYRAGGQQPSRGDARMSWQRPAERTSGSRQDPEPLLASSI